MRTQLPVPLIYPVLYAVVLVSGLYGDAVGLGPTTTIAFVAGLVVLATIDLVEARRFPEGAPPALATLLLIARTALSLTVIAADPSGIARVLLILLPFRVYFLIGRAAAVAVSAVLVAGMMAVLQVTVPAWSTSTEYVNDLLMFVVGLVLALAMASVAVEERRARDRLRRATAAAERSRLGREIHDGLGHHLTAISVLLEKASAFREIDPAVADAAIIDAHESARLALHDVRRSVRTLSDAEPFDLVGALTSLGRGLPVDITVSGDVGGFDDGTRLVLYRAAQEGITNALRHASATTIDVRVELDDQSASVTVTDDGRGFSTTSVGWGLEGVRERVENVGGQVDIESTAGAGTRLAVRVPRVTR